MVELLLTIDCLPFSCGYSYSAYWVSDVAATYCILGPQDKDITPAFCASAAMPSTQAIEQWLDHLEQFVVLLYDRTSSHCHVNKARKKNRAIDGLPPTQAALIQHVKRAAVIAVLK